MSYRWQIYQSFIIHGEHSVGTEWMGELNVEASHRNWWTVCVHMFDLNTSEQSVCAEWLLPAQLPGAPEADKASELYVKKDFRHILAAYVGLAQNHKLNIVIAECAAVLTVILDCLQNAFFEHSRYWLGKPTSPANYTPWSLLRYLHSILLVAKQTIKWAWGTECMVVLKVMCDIRAARDNAKMSRDPFDPREAASLRRLHYIESHFIRGSRVNLIGMRALHSVCSAGSRQNDGK